MSFSDYQKNRTLLEFNGPAGQPDPSGISSPSLKPRFPSAPVSTMGTQPGMSMQMPKSNPYQDFVNHLSGLNANDIGQIMQQLKQEVQAILHHKLHND